MKHLVQYLLPALFALAACSEDKPEPTTPTPTVPTDFVRVAEKTFTVEAEGNVVDITFESSGAWTASFDGKGAGWCKLSATSGAAGTNTLRVTVAANDTYDERNAAFFIASGRSRSLVTITQKQLDAIMLTSDKVEVEADGATFQVEMKTNMDVSYEIDAEAQSWLEPADSRSTRALETRVFSFRVLPNSADQPRQGGILFLGEGGLQERVTVYQAGDVPTLVLNSRDRLVVDSEGETLQLEVKSNVDYELVLPAVDWLSENKTRSVSTYTHYLTALPNTSYDPREAELVARSADGLLADTVVIYQMQRGAIVVAKDHYEVGGEESILRLRLSTNVDIDTQFSVPWITTYTARQTRGLEVRELFFRVAKNPDTEPRTGAITFVYRDITQRVTVEQAGRNDHLRLEIAHSEASFEPFGLWGSHFLGNIQWGDGTTTDLFQGHTFSSPALRTTTLVAMGVDSLRIDRLGTISSITIYCDDPQEAPDEE